MHSQGLHVLAINDHCFPIATVLNKENRAGATQILRAKAGDCCDTNTWKYPNFLVEMIHWKKKKLKANETFYLFPSKRIKKKNKVMAKKR